jgi:hypothetical protein
MPARFQEMENSLSLNPGATTWFLVMGIFYKKISICMKTKMGIDSIQGISTCPLLSGTVGRFFSVTLRWDRQ